MIFYRIKISFYQKPEICNNPSHKIDLLNVNDKYNPFSMHNKLSSFFISSSINDNLMQKLTEYFIKIDLNDHMNFPFNNIYIDELCSQHIIDIIWKHVNDNDLFYSNPLFFKFCITTPKKFKSMIFGMISFLMFGKNVVKCKEACTLNVIKMYDCRQNDFVEIK